MNESFQNRKSRFVSNDEKMSKKRKEKLDKRKTL